MKRFAFPLLLTLGVGGFFLFHVEIAAQTVGIAAQTAGGVDPGVRGGAAGAGDPFSTLTSGESLFFTAGQIEFGDTEDVLDGLGPTMNLDSCGGCHIQPALGGTSPAVNPQFAFAQDASPSQFPAVSSFIAEGGPVNAFSESAARGSVSLSRQEKACASCQTQEQ